MFEFFLFSFMLFDLHKFDELSTATFVSLAGASLLVRVLILDILAGFWEVRRRRDELKREREQHQHQHGTRSRQ